MGMEVTQRSNSVEQFRAVQSGLRVKSIRAYYCPATSGMIRPISMAWLGGTS
jgi:hypothetical protein